ncbi:MAG: heparinase II/III family protein [Lentisphaeria bacterium]|nr:heparinase II/III family protein [Lentisphaeria bacterium]
MNRKRKNIDPTPLFPPASDRTAWEQVLRIPRNRKLARELVRRARALLREPIPALPATLFMEYVRNGNRSHYEKNYFARRANLNTLILAEVIEYRGKFLDKIIDYLWEITAEHTWSLPAHCGMNLKTDPLPEPPTELVNLFSAETGMNLVQILNLLEAELTEVSPNLIRTLRENLLRRVLRPLLKKPFPFCWIHGKNNWTPWCCSNCLSTALCVYRDQPEQLEETVAVLQEGIDNFLRSYPADGAGTEGPVYWEKSPGMLLHYLEQLRIWTDDPKLKPMAEYIVDGCLTSTAYAAFGDCPARIAVPAENGRDRSVLRWPAAPWVCCRFGERLGSEALMTLGLNAAKDYPVRRLLGDLFAAQAYFFWIPDRRAGKVRKKPLVFYPDSQLMFLNEANIALAVKRGCVCNHHHSDVGQVILFHREQPLLIDLGRTEYRKETFSPDRMKNWRLNAEAHNIPQFNGIRQLDDSPAQPGGMTVSATPDGVVCRMDLTNTYPEEAGVRACFREVIWRRREKTLEIHDSWELKKRSGNTVRIPFYASLPVSCRAGEGKIGAVPFRLENASGSVEHVALDDSAEINDWGMKTVDRLDVTARSGPKGECRMIFVLNEK